MRKTLSLIQYTALTVAAVSLLIVWFTIGDTDVGPEAAPPSITLIFAVLAGVGILVGGLIQWIGVPLPDRDDASPNGPVPRQEDAAAGPRMWPAALIVLAHLAAIAYSIQAPTILQDAIGFALAPLLAMVLLAIWWLMAKQVPLKERLAGLALFAALLGAIVISQGGSGVQLLMELLMVAVPAITIGVVALLLITTRLRWRVRRWLAVGLMIGIAVVCTALRVDGIRGDFLPILAWRWSPTAEELFADWVQTPSGPAEAIELPAQPRPGDWPEFRGPARDSRLAGTTFATNWDEAPPREVWRRRVGLGWSSFTVVGDYAFTQEQRGPNEAIVCYRADTGDEVWVNFVTARFDDAMGSGPRATPTFNEGKLYTFGATGILSCLDASTGETLWERDVKTDTNAKIPGWGFASSPLVTGDLAIVFSGGPGGKSVAAYDRVSGDLAWTAGDGTHGYSSGQLARIADVPQVLITSDIGIQSLVPETGEVLWEHRWVISVKSNPRCVQPLVADSHTVMIGTAGGKGTRRLRIDRAEESWTVEEQWTTKQLRPYFNDFVYHDGYCYGFDGNRFTCIDAETGERRWTGKRYGGQVLLLPDMDALLVLTEKGSVVLLEATPEAHNEIAQFKALSGKTWNHPVIAHGKLYVRNSEEAACFELTI